MLELEKEKPTLNDWDKSFHSKLSKIPIGQSRVFFYIGCGSRKGTATKLPDGKISWLIPDVGDSNAVVMTIGECVEKHGYH